MARAVTAKKPARRSGRTKADPCHVRGCGGAARPGHFTTATHQRAVAALRVETGGPADEKRIFHIAGRDREDAYYDALALEDRAATVDWLIDNTLPPEPPADYAASMALITLREAGRRLGVKPDTLLKAIHRQKMTGHRYGPVWLVEESEVRFYEMASLGRVGWPKGRPRKNVA